MGYGWMWGHGWGGWLAMCVLMVVLWAGLIAATVLGIRYLGASGSRGSSPERLLEERFAQGDIDEEDYRRRLTVLRESR